MGQGPVKARARPLDKEHLMPVVLATKYVVPGGVNGVGLNVYDSVLQILWNETSRFLHQPDSEGALERAPLVEWESRDTNTTFRWEDWQSSDDPQIKGLSYHLSYPLDDRRWDVELEIGVESEDLHLGVIWRRSGPADSRTLGKTPRLLKALALAGGQSEDLAIPFSPQQLTLEDLQPFYEDVLSNPKRCTPVILAAPYTDGSGDPVDVEGLARRIFGLAHVYKFADDEAASEFKLRFGRAVACYDGGVRLYLSSQGLTETHPYWLGRRDPPQDIEQQLIQRVAKASAQSFERPEAMAILHRRRRQEERQNRDWEQQKLLHTETESAEWQQLLEEAFADNRDLIQERDHLQELNQRLQHENDDLRLVGHITNKWVWKG